MTTSLMRCLRRVPLSGTSSMSLHWSLGSRNWTHLVTLRRQTSVEMTLKCPWTTRCSAYAESTTLPINSLAVYTMKTQMKMMVIVVMGLRSIDILMTASATTMTTRTTVCTTCATIDIVPVFPLTSIQLQRTVIFFFSLILRSISPGFNVQIWRMRISTCSWAAAT